MRISTWFARPRPDPRLEREIAKLRSHIHHDTQVLQSGARVITTLSDALKLMAENHAK